MAGTRSSDAPCSAASPRPRAATRANDTMEAITVPVMAHVARVFPAPKRRYHRKLYTAETALPPGNELARACAANVVLRSDPLGARSPPNPRSPNCMAARLTKERNSATTEATSHHQFRRRSTVPRPDSSSVWAERTQAARATTARPRSTRTTGHHRRHPGPTRRVVRAPWSGWESTWPPQQG